MFVRGGGCSAVLQDDGGPKWLPSLGLPTPRPEIPIRLVHILFSERPPATTVLYHPPVITQLLPTTTAAPPQPGQPVHFTLTRHDLFPQTRYMAWRRDEVGPDPCTCVRAVRRGLDGRGLEGCGGVGLFWIEQSCAAGGEAETVHITSVILSLSPSPSLSPSFPRLYISFRVILPPSLLAYLSVLFSEIFCCVDGIYPL